jgi:hypothetical protein
MSVRHVIAPVRVSVCVFMAVALSACASAPIPEQQISLAKNAVNRAVSADANQYASLEIKSAQDKLFQMERALGEKHYVQAKSLAEQIEADANLAERKARAAKWQQQLAEARNGIQVLKQEMLQSPNAITPQSTAQ